MVVKPSQVRCKSGKTIDLKNRLAYSHIEGVQHYIEGSGVQGPNYRSWTMRYKDQFK